MARVLISAFSCFPGEGSEPGVGWKTVVAAAEEHEVWVITDCGREKALLEHPEVRDLPQVKWRFVRVPVLSAWAHGRWSHGLVWWVYYYVWQLFQGALALELHEEVGFDLCHHATYVKYNTPSALPMLGIPFLWGPVGGAERASMAFFQNHDWKVRLEERARLVLQALARFDPWLRWTAGKASVGLGVTEETASELSELGVRDCRMLPAVSLSGAELEQIQSQMAHPSSDEQAKPLTLIFAGRLIAWKGMDLALRAVAAANLPSVQLLVVGDGAERPKLQAMARALGIASKVTFMGGLSRAEVLKAYGRADGFLYPSLHDSGGQVVLEAMAAGLPAMVLRSGGPHVFVDESCGWKITARTPEQVVGDLVGCLHEFAANEGLRRSKGAAARGRAVQQFSTQGQASRLRQIYRDLLSTS